MPEALDPPEIMEGFGGWYEEFWRLSTERQIGFGIGPIPDSQIERRTAAMNEEDAEIFEFCIRRMDEVYLMKSNKTEQPEPAASPRDAFRAATSTRRRR